MGISARGARRCSLETTFREDSPRARFPILQACHERNVRLLYASRTLRCRIPQGACYKASIVPRLSVEDYSETYGICCFPSSSPKPPFLQGENPLPDRFACAVARWYMHRMSTLNDNPAIPALPHGGSFGDRVHGRHRSIPPSLEENRPPTFRVVNRPLRTIRKGSHGRQGSCRSDLRTTATGRD